MPFVLATFILVAGIVLGTYWLLLVRPEHRDTAQLRMRLTPVKQRKSMLASLMRDTQRLSDVPALDRSLARVSQLIEPVQRLVAQSGLKVTVGALLLMSGCLVGIGYLVVLRVTAMPPVALAGGCLAGFLPFAYVRRARTKRILKFEEQFPEAIDLLSRALRAGHALTTGLEMVAEELAEPVRGEFRQLYDEQSFGLPLPDAMRSFARRVPSLDARFFVTAVLTQRESGGNLSEVLDNLATIIRDRFRVKRQVRVISAHGRITGWVLAGLPPSLAIAFTFLMPVNYSKFVHDPLGVRMIVAAIAMQILGTLIIRKIVNIEY